MRRVTPYLHILDGRMRIRLDILKHSPMKAEALQTCLRSLKGIQAVTINCLTGSLLIHYDECQLSRDDLFALFGVDREMLDTPHVDTTEASKGRHMVGDIVLRVITECAVLLLLRGFGLSRPTCRV